jgi:hypothetical protein
MTYEICGQCYCGECSRTSADVADPADPWHRGEQHRRRIVLIGQTLVDRGLVRDSQRAALGSICAPPRELNIQAPRVEHSRTPSEGFGVRRPHHTPA